MHPPENTSPELRPNYRRERTDNCRRRCVLPCLGRTHWRLSCSRTEALAKVCLFVDEDFGRDHISERHEHLQYVLVSELLGQVVDEQVGTFGTWRDETQGGDKVRLVFHLNKTAGETSAALWQQAPLCCRHRNRAEVCRLAQYRMTLSLLLLLNNILQLYWTLNKDKSFWFSFIKHVSALH